MVVPLVGLLPFLDGFWLLVSLPDVDGGASGWSEVLVISLLHGLSQGRCGYGLLPASMFFSLLALVRRWSVSCVGAACLL